MKKTNTALSIKMNKEEIEMIEGRAKECGETKSRYARRVLVESVQNPFYTGEDVMRLLMEIGYDLQGMNLDNAENMIADLNIKGEKICQILSLR